MAATATAALPVLVDPTLLAGAAKPAAAANATPAEIRKIAEQFESMMLNQMLAPMFEGLDTDGPTGGGIGEAMFRPMMIEQYAASIAKAGGVGVSEAVAKEMMRLQGVHAGGDAPPAAAAPKIGEKP
jgi:peptidoglycan hydrolase FlgJ